MNKVLLQLLWLFGCLSFGGVGYGQLSGGTWLVSGTGAYYKQKFKVAGEPVRRTYIDASPHVGYFVFDRLAVGLKGQWNYDGSKGKYVSSKSYFTTVGAGPFVRYYFLPEENRGNFFAESAYQYSDTWTSDGGPDLGKTEHVYSFSAGPTYYFNSSVGLELALGYQIGNTPYNRDKYQNLSFGIGLQFSLEKEK